MVPPSPNSGGIRVYRPGNRFKGVVAGAAAVFVAATVVVAVTEQPMWVRIASIAWLVVAVGGLLELVVARLELLDHALVTRSALGSITRSYSDIEAVRLEGGQLHVKLRNSSWQHLPAWLSDAQAQSARAYLAKRVGERA